MAEQGDNSNETKEPELFREMGDLIQQQGEAYYLLEGEKIQSSTDRFEQCECSITIKQVNSTILASQIEGLALTIEARFIDNEQNSNNG